MLAILPLVAVSMGGSTARWSEGIILVAVGLILLAIPPRTSPGWAINVVLAGLVALAATAFLPSAWFRNPAWRAALTDDLGASLPGTLGPQPWLSAESSLLLLGGIAWFYLMATVAWTSAERPRAGRWYAGGVVLLAAAFVVSCRLHVVPSFWHSLYGFGPFPNRNHTADFLAVGALPVLACAHLAWRGGRRVAAGAWLAGWAIVVSALFQNFSRAGIGILFAGTAAWLGNEMFRAIRRGAAGEGGRKTSFATVGWRAAALAVSLVLLLASGFMFFGGDTLARLRPGSTEVGLLTTTGDFRISIQRDALDLIADSPWCGVGLGSFESVFAPYRQRSAVELRTLHPESDWVWMTAELGWPAFALAAVGVVLLVRRAWPRRPASDRPLRAAAALGAMAFALHGFVDVSAHRVGTAWCGLFLLGLALPGPGEEKTEFRRPAPWGPWVFRLLGLLLAGMGAAWLLADRGKIHFPGEQEVATLAVQSRAEAANDQWGQSVATASRALALDPVNWQLYYQRAFSRLGAGEDHAAVQADFRRAFYLEPFLGRIVGYAAVAWARAGEPDLAVSALLEASRRMPAEAPGYFTGVSEASGDEPAFFARLAAATASDPEWHTLYIEQLPPLLRPQAVAATVASNPDLSGYDNARKFRLFRFWSGDNAAVVAAMETHPAWQQIGWRVWANALAATGSLDQACRVAARFAPKPAVPDTAGADLRSLAELQAATLQSPGDLTLALRLYRGRLAAGDTEGALAALQAVTTHPGCPAYFNYLEASLATGDNRWVNGWDAWERYLATVPENR